MVTVKTQCFAFVSLIGFSLVTAPVGAANHLYRYVNSDGVIVINHTVPPELVHQGYEVLYEDGTVARVVDRTPTAEELADQSGEAYRRQMEKEEAERLRKWDESLMLRYSTVEDIEAARERALSELKIRINILRSNLRSLQRQVENNQARAADIERSGGKVPVEIISAIDAQRNEIKETERSIQERLREVDFVDEGFQRDIDRFALLLDKVELRQRYSRGEMIE